jgi:ubiquinone/menaquinone biosynthesis C-methylase UbiE
MAQQAELKSQVRDYWNTQPCGTQFSESSKYSKEYFDEIEEHRYTVEPEIFSFAQFTRFHGQKILEVGTGAGTDFLQWVRAGAKAYGIDATSEGIQHLRQRLEVYDLEAEEVKVADCESLPYPDNSFDLVYSWGVIHHSPNTPQALREIIRVCRPGGICKVMVYHRHSLLSYFFWVKYALLKGKPWRSLSWCLFHHMESIGTKAYTRKEIRSMLSDAPVDNIRIEPMLSYYDRMGRFSKLFQSIAKVLAVMLGGNRVGWFLTIQFTKR